MGTNLQIFSFPYKYIYNFINLKRKTNSTVKISRGGEG